jgi:hypothetical protein
MIQEDWPYPRRTYPLKVMELFLRRPRISTFVADKIAQMYILELEKRSAIHCVEGPRIDSVYTFDERVIPK